MVAKTGMKLNLTNGESISRAHPDFLPPGDANFRTMRNGKQIRSRVRVCGEAAPEFPYYRCSRCPDHGDDCAAHGGENSVVMYARWEKSKPLLNSNQNGD